MIVNLLKKPEELGDSPQTPDWVTVASPNPSKIIVRFFVE
ncbi:hypothetical protein FDUTEX481_08075 [Tolypothrix sp. PCC 7601]|nr:hypothetical protein FDUTEX481_08075 [Tolypothrix sp. PCC 7601]